MPLAPKRSCSAWTLVLTRVSTVMVMGGWRVTAESSISIIAEGELLLLLPLLPLLLSARGKRGKKSELDDLASSEP